VHKAEFRVLYMEDDAGLACLLQKNLRRRGYQVDIAANGEEGVAMADRGGYDIVLVDYDMPRAGGVDVLRTLTDRPDGIPPLIMLTGKGNERVAVEALKLGATDYIVKDPDMNTWNCCPSCCGSALETDAAQGKGAHSYHHTGKEERYRKLVDLSPDGIAIVARQEFVFINPSGVSLLGAGEEAEIIGMRLLDRMHDLSRERTAGWMATIEEHGQAMPWVEERMLKLDGAPLDVELSAVPFLYEGRGALQLIFRDITDRKLAKERLEQLAHFDHLTMLPNRALFFDRLGYLLDQARRYEFPFALLFLDLDRFKDVNDTLGHPTGDLLLKQVGERLTECLRRSDTIARMGGDEFTVILSRVTEPADAGIVAEKLLKTFENPFLLKGELRNVGASIGISLFPQDGHDSDTLLKKADTAMYRAKEGGRNGYRYFGDA